MPLRRDARLIARLTEWSSGARRTIVRRARPRRCLGDSWQLRRPEHAFGARPRGDAEHAIGGRRGAVSPNTPSVSRPPRSCAAGHLEALVAAMRPLELDELRAPDGAAAGERAAISPPRD
jgi:hypothetical protein